MDWKREWATCVGYWWLNREGSFSVDSYLEYGWHAELSLHQSAALIIILLVKKCSIPKEERPSNIAFMPLLH